MRSATSRWNIRVSESHQGGQASWVALPALAEIAAHYPGRLEVVEADALEFDPRPLIGDQRAGVEFQRVGLHHLEAAGIMRGDLGERRQGARSSSPAG
jgi:hypothetical protein